MVTAFKLKFTSPLHLGSVRADYDNSETTWHSDSLYAALIRAWCDLGVKDQLNQFINEENGQPLGYAVSSLYPYCKTEEGTRYFLPAPSSSLVPATIDLRKKVKKLQFIDHQLYGHLQDRGQIDVTADVIWGEFLTTVECFNPKFIRKKVFARARVPRTGVTNETEIYYLERIFFKEDSGLYCIVNYDDELTRKRIKAMLEFLGDEGIGTDRHVGNGFFEVEEVTKEEFDVNELFNVSASHATNVSLFCPESAQQWEQMLDEQSTYQLIKRGGWITAPGLLSLRKNSVYMLKEGGIFRLDKSVAGTSVDLFPDELRDRVSGPKKVFRCGKSLFLPINLQNA